MKAVCLTLILSFLCVSQAGSENLSTENSTVAISYGFASVTFSSGQPQSVKLEHPAPPAPEGISFSMVKSAEADELPFTDHDFEKMLRKINGASRLDDLKAVLSPEYYALLQAKVKEGVSQYTVLEMFKAMHPENVRLLDTVITENKAQLAVSGQSHFGPMQGLIILTNSNEEWKIAQEGWHASRDNIAQTRHPIGLSINDGRQNKFVKGKRSVLMTSISPEYGFKRNFLPLSRVTDYRNKRAFSFIFLMNKDRPKYGEPTVFNPSRGRLHILGSRSVFRQQKLIKDKLPIDVSLAQYKDGYAKDQWNLVLPSRKPREVTVSFLWSF